MKPTKNQQRNWHQLSDNNGQTFIYASGEGSVKLDLRSVKGLFTIREIDLKTGVIASERPAVGQIEVTGSKHPALFWITNIP
jgi:hypothetical protein